MASFVTVDQLSYVKAKIEEAVSVKYQTITYDTQTRVISFFKNDGTGNPDVTVTLPADVDISGKMDKLSNATLGNVVVVAADGEVADGAVALADLATEAYVDSAIGAINSFDYVAETTLPTATAETMYKIYLIPNTGSGTNVKDEYITIRSGEEGAYTYTWELFGSTEIDLSGYVPTSRTIAGVDLLDDITKTELLTALNVADGATATEVDTTNKSISDGTNTLSGIWTDDEYEVATDAEVMEALEISPNSSFIPINASVSENVGGTVEP